MIEEKPLGIIAGEGQFPFLVVQGAKYQGRKVVAVGFKDHTSTGLYPLLDHMCWIRLGQLSKLISYFKKQGVQEVVFAGGIRKPKALKIRPDLKAAKLLFQIRNKGDHTLLSGLARMLEKENLKIISPLQFVPDLWIPQGNLTRRGPSKQEQCDIDFGWPIAKEMGRLDIGQCIVVHNQMVVAVEAMEGTNETVLRAGRLLGQGGVLVKIFKPGQSSLIDQPAVGLKTVETLIEARIHCLAIEAEKGLFFDRQQALGLADEYDICITGIKSQ